MYRIEFFNAREHKNTAAIFIDEANIQPEVDYISPKAFTVEGPADCGAEYGNTAAIYSDAELVGVFVVNEVRRRKYGTTVTLIHPVQALNHKSKMGTADTWASQIFNQIKNDYTGTSPALFNFPIQYDTAYPVTNWGTYAQTFGAELMTCAQDIILAAKTYGLFMHFSISTAAATLGEIKYGFEPISTKKTAEINLDNVFSKEVTEDNTSSPNIAVIWTDTLGRYTATLINGVITYDGSKRSEIDVPVIVTRNVADGTAWADVKRIIDQLLQPSNDGLQITIQVAKNDRIFTDNKIGEKYRLIDTGREYDTILTGWRYSGSIKELKFGSARISLTEKLNGGNTND